MTDETDAGGGWFADVAPEDVEAGAEAIRDGRADAHADWPARAVEAGWAPDEATYYGRLRTSAIEAARAGAAERESADDRQLVHAVRAMDDCGRTANELAERLAEWAASRDADAGTGVDYAREVVEREAVAGDAPADALGERLRALAERVAALDDEADALRAEIERLAPEVAPNLAAMAGPVLAARLIALAGDLESLAKMPSGTVQVLGAEDALFAHLHGDAPPPKHGVIYTHEAVSGTRPEDRGSAARALAGKLTIAARVDHYSGDRRPELGAELEDRIDTIRDRAGGGGA